MMCWLQAAAGEFKYVFNIQSQALLCVGLVGACRDLPDVRPRARYVFL